MNNFAFSEDSENKLNGVDLRLAWVLREALKYSEIQFEIQRGVDHPDETNMSRRDIIDFHRGGSNHRRGQAIDVVCASNTDEDYIKIALAVKQAADAGGFLVYWGGCWNKPVNYFTESCAEECRCYAEINANNAFNGSVDLTHYQVIPGV